MRATRKPKGHAEWKQRQQKKGTNKKNDAGEGKGENQQLSQKLELSDAMKAALAAGDLSALAASLEDQSKE